MNMEKKWRAEIHPECNRFIASYNTWMPYFMIFIRTMCESCKSVRAKMWIKSMWIIPSVVKKKKKVEARWREKENNCSKLILIQFKRKIKCLKHLCSSFQVPSIYTFMLLCRIYHLKWFNGNEMNSFWRCFHTIHAIDKHRWMIVKRGQHTATE